MRKIIIIACLLVLNGCSHAYVRQWGNGQIVACCPGGNIWCSREKLDDLAGNQCSGEATAIGGQLVDSGATFSNAWGGLSMRNTSDGCVTYQCGGVRPASIQVNPDLPL